LCMYVYVGHVHILKFKTPQSPKMDLNKKCRKLFTDPNPALMQIRTLILFNKYPNYSIQLPNFD
jgi:hypothetical protein